MACPGSVALSAKCPPSKSSPAAAEGTATHTLSEELVTKQTTEPLLLKRVGTTMKTWDGFTVKITDEMVAAAVLYRDTIAAEKAGFPATSPVYGKAEAKVIASSVDPELHGTSDFVMFQIGNRLVVIDLKYGKKAVNPEKNKQLGIYAIGALDTLVKGAIKEVELVVVQPRAGGKSVRRWTAPLSWIDELRAELRAAIAATRKPNAPLNAGRWCFFCPAQAGNLAKGIPPCPAILGEAVKQAQTDFAMVSAPQGSTVQLPDVRKMAAEKVATVLMWESTFINWFAQLRAHAQQEIEEGRSVPGYKLVYGKAHRKWKDEEAAAEELEFLFGPAVLTKPELKSPSQVEKITGKGNLPAHLVDKPQGEAVLVPYDDPRPEAQRDALIDFASVLPTDSLADLL